MNKSLLLVIILFCFQITANAQKGFKNPILMGMYPDPSICKAGDDYYLGYRPRSGHHILGRETFLAPVDWQKNEWPIVNNNGSLSLEMPVHLNSIEHIEKEMPLEDGTVNLKIEGTLEPSGYAKANYYTFSFAQKNKPYTTMAMVEAKYLSTETAGGFTGIYLGMSASGNGQNSTATADFDWFEYQGK